MHLLVAFYASPRKIQKLIEFVNKELEYPIEGRLFKGTTRPFMSQLPFGLWDIRCKREIAPLVLRDLRAAYTGRPRSPFRKARHGHLNMKDTARASFFIHSGIWVFRTLTPFKDLEVAGGPAEKQSLIPGWHYCWFFGAWPDAIDEWGNEVL